MFVTRLFLAVVGGLALTSAFEPLAWAPLALVGVACFVLATRGLRVRSAAVVGLVFGVAFYFTHIYWMRDSVGTDAWLALAGVEAAFYGVLGATVPLLRRLWAWPVWLAATWTAVELLRTSWPFSGMPWGRVSYAAIDTPVAAASAYVGLVVLSNLLVLVSILLAELVASLPASVPLVSRLGRGRPRTPTGGSRVRPLWPLAGLVLLLAGLMVPALVPFEVARSGDATVAAVQGDVPGRGNDILYDPYGVTDNHAEATERLAADVAAGRRPRPDFVLWPENSTAADPFTDARVGDDIRDAVAAIGVPVVVGALVDQGADHILNQAIVWDPETGAGDRYTKHHPVAYGEYIPYRSVWDPKFGDLALITRDMLSGTRTTPLRVGSLEVAAATCFDIAYDDVLTDQVRFGAQLVALQSSNAKFIFTDQIDQQFAITRLRAIETGRWLVVATPNGRTGVIAPDGTVVSSAEPRTTAVLDEQVGLSTTLTPAMRMGAWPGRVFTVLSLLGLVLGGVAYRRSLQTGGQRSPGEASPPPPPDAETTEDPTPSEAPVG